MQVNGVRVNGGVQVNGGMMMNGGLQVNILPVAEELKIPETSLLPLPTLRS